MRIYTSKPNTKYVNEIQDIYNQWHHLHRNEKNNP